MIGRSDAARRADPLALSRLQADRLAVLLDALGDPEVSLPELASLAWLAGQDLVTVENIATVIRRTRPASTAEARQDAARVLLARCCDHHGAERCECAEQVAADVTALAAAGLLGGRS